MSDTILGNVLSMRNEDQRVSEAQVSLLPAPSDTGLLKNQTQVEAKRDVTAFTLGRGGPRNLGPGIRVPDWLLGEAPVRQDEPLMLPAPSDPDRDPGDPGGDPDPEPQSGGFHKNKRPRFTGRGFRLGETPLIPSAGFTPWDKEVAFKVPDRGFTPYESTFYPVFRGNRARTGTQVRAEPVPASQALVTADYFQQYNLQQLAGDASLASDTKPVSARVEMEAAPRATPTVVNYVAPAGAASLRTAAGGGADGGGDLPPQFDCAMCSREAFLMGAALSYAF